VPHQLDLAGQHDVERVARISLVEDRPAAGDIEVGHPRPEVLGGSIIETCGSPVTAIAS
jgi:hypothetical protein